MVLDPPHYSRRTSTPLISLLLVGHHPGGLFSDHVSVSTTLLDIAFSLCL